MARITIRDLPKDQKIGTKELKKVIGGVTGDLGTPRFIRASLWSPGVYASRPVDPPPPTGGGGRSLK